MRGGRSAWDGGSASVRVGEATAEPTAEATAEVGEEAGWEAVGTTCTA